jgi:primase-polymerase (primpol)-like protein
VTYEYPAEVVAARREERAAQLAALYDETEWALEHIRADHAVLARLWAMHDTCYGRVCIGCGDEWPCDTRLILSGEA